MKAREATDNQNIQKRIHQMKNYDMDHYGVLQILHLVIQNMLNKLLNLVLLMQLVKFYNLLVILMLDHKLFGHWVILLVIIQNIHIIC